MGAVAHLWCLTCLRVYPPYRGRSGVETGGQVHRHIISALSGVGRARLRHLSWPVNSNGGGKENHGGALASAANTVSEPPE